MNPTVVVAAVIERDGQVLICRRREDAPHPLKWEFPGGKVEQGEELVQALARELHEELGIHAAIGREITRYAYQYPGRRPILLVFYAVSEYAGELANRVFSEIAWSVRERLPEYDFLEGDLDFVRALANGGA